MDEGDVFFPTELPSLHRRGLLGLYMWAGPMLAVLPKAWEDELDPCLSGLVNTQPMTIFQKLLCSFISKMQSNLESEKCRNSLLFFSNGNVVDNWNRSSEEGDNLVWVLFCLFVLVPNLI